MKIHYNAATGDFKVRPSIRAILAVGVTFAGVKITYDFVTAAYHVSAIRLSKSLNKKEI